MSYFPKTLLLISLAFAVDSRIILDKDIYSKTIFEPGIEDNHIFRTARGDVVAEPLKFIWEELDRTGDRVYREVPGGPLESISIDEMPVVLDEEPVLLDENRVLLEQKPVVQEEKPVLFEQKPVVQDEKPVLFEQKPVVQDEKPGLLEQKPVVQEEKPVLLEQKPVVQDEKPGLLEQKPVVQDKKPVLLEQKPVLLEPKPVLLEPKPVFLEPKPVLLEPKPVLLEKKPVLLEQKPVVQDEKPIKLEQKPVVQDEKPIKLEQKPVVQDEKPVVQDEKPVVQDEKPIKLEQKPLLVDKPIPLDKTSSTTEETIIAEESNSHPVKVTDDRPSPSNDNLPGMSKAPVFPGRGGDYAVPQSSVAEELDASSNSLEITSSSPEVEDDIVHTDVPPTVVTSKTFFDVVPKSFFDVPFPVVTTDSPIVTTPTPVTTPKTYLETYGDFVYQRDEMCPKVNGRFAVFLSAPLDPTIFYICDWGKAIKFNCPVGLFFNPKYNVCDWPYNVEF